ncbi:Aste57867_21438 [Aphanomyces stellatus]|uniref:Aste57867_21438 protein n=1 Tax=Aphanomyces stellatus TaxID=120398 RepID=A0A485LI75_9STRA|nr:hypothetical protein As57867_021369 [Aphanomyces stellatus]VFT98109.1 Aste57867_21438 [Aphanomyces stellatus]
MSYTEWSSVHETIQTEPLKHVLVLFDAPWASAKTKKALSNLEALLGPHRTDLVQARVDVSDMDDDDVMDLGVGELPFFQLYSQGKLVAGLDAGSDQTSRNLVRYIGWNADAEKDLSGDLPAIDYVKLTALVDSITKGESDFIANCANVSAAIWFAFHEAQRPVNWAGFYFNRPVEGTDTRLLVLGPFHGKPACKRIQMHSGVCGAAASTRLIQRIPNVNVFPGHIACDSASQSELVVPILVKGDLIGVLDLDCPKRNGFQAADADGLQAIVDLFAARTHWDSFHLPVRNLPLEAHPDH